MPMGQVFDLEPGKTYSGKITVVNPADATSNFYYKSSIAPYSVIGDDYTADLTTKYDRSLITDWITISNPTGEISPNSSKDVIFTITVPEDAPAGGQYAAITVSSDNRQTENGAMVQNVFEMASIIYARVAGEITHKGNIIKNEIPGFSSVAPISVGAVISNDGNVHENAIFSLKVSDVFSGKVILPTDEDSGRYNEIIMPGTTRQIVRNISDLPTMGIIRVSQTIYYNGETSTVEKDILICPIWFIALLSLLIISIITSIIIFFKKHGKKLHHI